MASTGEPYTVAARVVDQGAAVATATLDPQLLKPYPDETDVTVEELGWRVLPTDATPRQRARAEAIWRPVAANRRAGAPDRATTANRAATDRTVSPPAPASSFTPTGIPGRSWT
jgi:hypothetical protein